ncbi:hypothetical protein BFJ72_g2591 [Fusarium proliferatum]|uniref:Uncharacterized protein n=1 Tax=Gibberella intermedia TaxID=948311 RepID=A0A420TZB4_GIBIN|nr:hypothetical protein BFJ72_g2591 [Fusarium proliferatum]
MSLDNTQDLPGDIRRHHDIRSPNADVVFFILQTRPPIIPDISNTTGLQCMTAIFRRIYSHNMLGPDGLANTQHFRQAEAENPVMSFAWQMFGQDLSSRQLRHDAWMKTKTHLEQREVDVSATFEELCTSRMMNHTYWSQNEMRLLEPKMCCETWRTVGENTEEIASSSLVSLDRNMSPDMTVQQAVESSFGIIRREGKHTLQRPARPHIIRILYSSGSGPRLSFRELRDFNLPIWRETQDRQNPFDTSERAQYVILAVVRMRANLAANDLVRLYAASGAEIVPVYEDIPCMGTHWSIEDENQHRYMLFYAPPGYDARLDDAYAFPEVAGPLIKDDDDSIAYLALVDKAMRPYIEKAEAERVAAAASNNRQGGSFNDSGGPFGDSLPTEVKSEEQ